jgi:Fe-Mn family superoxide dismutase
MDLVEKLHFDSLIPYISDEQLYFHYEKHHKNYEKNLNNLLNKEEIDKGLEYIIYNYKENKKIFNNAAQIYNHNLFWKSIQLDTFPKEYDIEKYYVLKEQFFTKSIGGFGSGWIWIVENNGNLLVDFTKDAEISNLGRHLIVMDMWEHTYYLDYKSNRLEFIEVFFFNLMNWNVIIDFLK